jgi:hypothetical protein
MHNSAIIKTMVTSQGAHEQASYFNAYQLPQTRYLLLTLPLEAGFLNSPVISTPRFHQMFKLVPIQQVQVSSSPNMAPCQLEIHQQVLLIVKLLTTLTKLALVED